MINIPSFRSVVIDNLGSFAREWYNYFEKVFKHLINYNQPITEVTVGASPFTYKNNTDYNIDFLLHGGTISDISLTRNITVDISLLKLVSLSPGDSISITYSSIPTCYIIPR